MPQSNLPVGYQIAALPLRRDADGAFQVLMITSRGTGRWVMPKGWHMDGRKPWRAAEIEALEEAGAIGQIGAMPIGQYRYDKVLDDGTALPCAVDLFPMMVERLKRNWKERNERTRHWFTLRQAAKRVDEPDLAVLLRSLAHKPHKHPEIRPLLHAMIAR